MERYNEQKPPGIPEEALMVNEIMDQAPGRESGEPDGTSMTPVDNILTNTRLRSTLQYGPSQTSRNRFQGQEQVFPLRIGEQITEADRPDLEREIRKRLSEA